MAHDATVLLDLEFGLNQLSGSRDLLFKMLTRFQQDYAPLADELEPLVQSLDYEAIRHKTHTVKGVAGNLGMWALHDVSKHFEDAAKEQNPSVASHLTPFVTCLQNTLNEINAAQGTSSSDSGQQSSTDIEAAGGDISELKQLLAQNEFISNDKLESMLASSGLESSVQDEIIQAINDLDYEAALALLG